MRVRPLLDRNQNQITDGQGYGRVLNGVEELPASLNAHAVATLLRAAHATRPGAIDSLLELTSSMLALAQLALPDSRWERNSPLPSLP